MVKASSILGINARAMSYSYRYNTSLGRSIATSKLKTKKYLAKASIPIPETYAVFRSVRKLNNFDWSKLPESFALKPNKGLGGEGIIVAKKKSKDGLGWITTKKTKVTFDDLYMHVQDIIEGAYSIHNEPDTAYIEEYVGRNKAFRKFAYRGTPDIRIIVFNKVPVMAMLRLPTKESGGRANLHQGAIAVGVDIATGITTKAYWQGQYIKYKPETKRKLHGIKIPQWNTILQTAVACQEATKLGYFGVDVVLHPKKGPMVLELNYMPGLQIQIANSTGLKKRLERIEDLDIKDAEHGVRISKVLFADRFSDRVKVKEGIKILSPIEKVKIFAPKKKRIWAMARIDTGALRSSIDRDLAEKLGLLSEENILWKRKYAYRSAAGKQSRPIIGLKLSLAGRKISTSASVANRSNLSTPILIGRNDLVGFFVNPVEIEK